MRHIESKDFSQHFERSAVFICGDHVVVNHERASHLISFSEGLACLPVDQTQVFLDQELLFVHLQEEPAALSSTFKLAPAKYFLSEVSSQATISILRAVQWLNWNQKHRYCQRCAHPFSFLEASFEKKCHSCGHSVFPNLAPVIVVLIQKGDELLLARSPHFREGMYSAIAGFIDMGETAECAVHRETQEEVGLKIHQLEYFGTQSWPFPGDFMIAFKAQYLSGDIAIDQKEIEHAAWFHKHDLPELPLHSSLSRQLIDHCVAACP